MNKLDDTRPRGRRTHLMPAGLLWERRAHHGARPRCGQQAPEWTRDLDTSIPERSGCSYDTRGISICARMLRVRPDWKPMVEAFPFEMLPDEALDALSRRL